VAKKVDGDIFKFFQKEEKRAVVSVCTNTRAPNETFSSKAQLASMVTTDIPPANSKPLQPPEYTLENSELSDDQVKTTLPLPISNFDIASYTQKVKGLNTPDICTLIKSVFRPHRNYVFPCLSEKNKRKYEWLDLFPWLCYSASEDGAYCLSCVLFGDHFPCRSSRITRLVSKPFCYWNDAMSTF
jgi:hypothetical protein